MTRTNWVWTLGMRRDNDSALMTDHNQRETAVTCEETHTNLTTSICAQHILVTIAMSDGNGNVRHTVWSGTDRLMVCAAELFVTTYTHRSIKLVRMIVTGVGEIRTVVPGVLQIGTYNETWDLLGPWVKHGDHEWNMGTMSETWGPWVKHGDHEWNMGTMSETWGPWVKHGDREWNMGTVSHGQWMKDGEHV